MHPAIALVVGVLLLSTTPRCSSVSTSKWTGSNLPETRQSAAEIRDALQLCPRVNEAFVRTDVLAAFINEEAPAVRSTTARSSFEPLFYSSITGNYTAHNRALDLLAQSIASPADAVQRMPCGPVDEVKREVDLDKLLGTCKVVVATAIFGESDVLHPPAPTSFPHHVCYVAFVDSASAAFMESKGYDVGDTCEGWQIVRFGKPITGNARLDSRIFKILLPRLLPPSVRWSIWLDSKHRLDVDPARLLYLLLWQYDAAWSVPNHGSRVTVQDEQEAVVGRSMVPRQQMLEQRRHHRSKGFTLHTTTGLLEGALHLRDHGSPLTHVLSCTWWNELVQFPPRDQTSFNYLLYRLGFRAAVTPQQFLALRLMLTDFVASYKTAFHLTYDLHSSLFNTTVHVAARCDFLSMMPIMHHVTVPVAYARLADAIRMVSSAAAARQAVRSAATGALLLRGSPAESRRSLGNVD